MQIKTHVASSLSIFLILDAFLSNINSTFNQTMSNIFAQLIGVSMVIISQYLIDSIGHTQKFYKGYSFPARNKWHSLPGVILIGAGIGMMPAVYYNYPLSIVLFIAPMILHWFEDLITEGGVYLFNTSKRIRLSRRLKYDSAWLNRITIVICYIPAVLYYPAFSSTSNFIVASFVGIYNAYAFLTV